MWKTVIIIIAAMVILIITSFAVFSIIFKRKVRKEARELLQKSGKEKKEIVTEEDLIRLPEPIQKYLKYAQIIGKEKTRTVRLKQKGFFRQKMGQKWTPLKAEQYYTTNPPAFIWFGRIKIAPLLSITARDMYIEGKGNMLIKLLSTFTVADAKGKEMDEASLMRYLNEMMWFPAAYLNDYVQWEGIDDKSAKATISDKGVTASAILYFNEKGELKNFVGERFCSLTGKNETWSTPISEYKEINGMRIPIKGEGVWNLSSGDFSYIRVEITDIEYSNPTSY
jgi:hypothetical protein